MKFTTITTSLKALALAVVLFGGALSMAAYTAPPSSQSDNTLPPVNVGEESQIKPAGLATKTLQVGKTGSIVVDADGRMAVGSTQIPAGVRLYVNGVMRVSSLAGNGLKILCTSSATSTDFKTCGSPKVTFNVVGSGESPTSFRVPKGITSITVEVYGAGGGASAEPGATNTDGGRSRFVGNGVELVAGGGKASKSFEVEQITTGIGTTTLISMPPDADKGSEGGSASGGSTVVKGASGSNATAFCTGGKGGKAPGSEGGLGGGGGIGTNGGTTSGGRTGLRDLFFRTVYAQASNWNAGGAGSKYGGGAGGIGCKNTESGKWTGFGGAGSGGYVKHTLSVSEGQIYRVEIGKGGSGGAKGGDGAVVVTF